MSSQDAYGRRYWSVSIYQARLLFFLPAEFRRLRAVKEQAEAAGALSLKKVNWEKLHVLGLLEVDRGNRAWVYVRRGPDWAAFWHALAVDPDCAPQDQAAQLARLDAAFEGASQNTIPLPHLPGADLTG
jgi:hypothetical protein